MPGKIQKIVFMLRKFIKDISRDRQIYEISKDLHSQQLDVEEQKMIYYPISIGQYGLAIWHTYLKTKSEKDLNRFLKIAEWFYQNGIQDEKLGVYWLTDVDKPAYRISKPWKSAFSQARGINILMRAYQVTGKKEYEEVSQLMFLFWY